MHRYLILILLALSILSCDPGYRADILNKSDREIEVVFEYDKKAISQNLERNIPFISELIYDNEMSRTVFGVDTTNFIVTARIQPYDTLIVEMEIGTHPDFDNISAIRINTPDTIVLDTKEKMLGAFDERRKFKYELAIK